MTQKKSITNKTSIITKTNIKTGMNRKIELLSPAGSLEICKAVINAGADAVYLGGKSFSARAYAGNLSNEEIIEVIDYAHLRGAKIYLTLNTLLKEEEIKSIFGFLSELYAAGLDAVIVQDFGCMKIIREAFPEMSIHASTQMAVMTHFFAEQLKNDGVSRIVLPREMTLEEIRQIYDKTGLELEVFVHGALCYSYSGQCLFSSMHGNRSGNRGSCAQPCRLKFTAEGNSARLLCTKDIAALSAIPELANAGAASLKIEGRMKNVYYAAGVTHIYRKYMDSFFSGEFEELISSDYEEDLKKLAALYNRGSFSRGLLFADKGRELLSLKRANNRGVAALKLCANKKGHITFEAIEHINRRDVFEISAGNSFTSGKEVDVNERFEIDLPSRFSLKPGDIIYRMNDNALQDYIKKQFVDNNSKIDINMKLECRVGRPARLKLLHLKSGCSAEIEGERVQSAQKAGVSKDELKSRICKLGATDFTCRDVQIEADENIFISNRGVNELRRKGIALLCEKVLSKSEKSEIFEKNNFLFAIDGKNDIIGGSMPENHSFSALVNTAEQLKAVWECERIKRVYAAPASLNVLKTLKKFPASLTDKGSHKELFVALPLFFRERHIELFKEDISYALSFEPEGFLVRSADQISAFAAYKEEFGISDSCKLVTDYQVYAYNSASLSYLEEITKRASLVLDRLTAPVELTGKEITKIGASYMQEAVVYGRMILMLSEHCVRKSIGRCSRDFKSISLYSEKNEKYTVVPDCRYCNNAIYDSSPVLLYDEFVSDTDIRFFRLDFTTETKEETLAALKALEHDDFGSKNGFFKGRFYTGVL